MNCCDANGDCNQGRNCPIRKETMNSRKHPRTLNEAFGPYTSSKITETDPPYDWQDQVAILAGYLTVLFLIAIAVWDF